MKNPWEVRHDDEAWDTVTGLHACLFDSPTAAKEAVRFHNENLDKTTYVVHKKSRAPRADTYNGGTWFTIKDDLLWILYYPEYLDEIAATKIAEELTKRNPVGFEVSEATSETDPHRLKAAELFKVPYHEVTEEQRRRAKVINFGEMYGIDPKLGEEFKNRRV